LHRLVVLIIDTFAPNISIDAFTTASREQAQSTQLVSQAMQTIANITQESSTGAEETSKTVRDLVDLSEQLTKSISRFKND
jgi:methyl-accepting chemotaxis protein